jgi:ubiquinone/menaquinone biosynthesis C-methylase UbiE
MYAEHMTRYESAIGLVSGKTVLDIASGSGYGTNMLAKAAKKIYGVDIDKEAIAYAQENYGTKNTEFLVGDGEKIPLDDQSVDVVTTFETIEHIEDYNKFLDEVDRVLKPGGTVLVSTPNDLEYPEGNHFHLHEFEYSELSALLKARFKYVVPYFQVTYKSVVVGSEDFFSKEGEVSMLVQNMSPQNIEHYVYFYFVCSNKMIDVKIKPILSLGELYSEKLWIEQREWAAKQQQQIESYQKHITNVENHLKYLETEMTTLKDEMTTLKDSRAYKVASKISDFKNKNKQS